jgi:hypothetical protein
MVGRVHGFKIIAKSSQNLGNSSVTLTEGRVFNSKYYSLKKFIEPWKH